MTMKKIMISLSMLVFSAALVSSAQAWTSWGTKDGNAHMVASADPGGWNGDTGVYQAYIRAAGSWNKQTCSNFRFTADDPALQDRDKRRDGKNHIEFGRAGSGALAVTYLQNNSSNRECDMVIGDDIKWRVKGWPRLTEFDLESVVVHEMGHMLGLGHSAESEATMYYAVGPGDDRGRTLHQDDIDGICSLY